MKRIPNGALSTEESDQGLEDQSVVVSLIPLSALLQTLHFLISSFQTTSHSQNDSLELWTRDHPDRILPPAIVDVATAGPGDWNLPSSAPPVGAMLCINMTHIAPWSATMGLLHAAADLLAPDGLLFIYGPFKVYGAIEPESNARFDAALRAKDPEWGYREVADIIQEANTLGLTLEEQRAMPANNLMLIFRHG